MSHQFVIKLKDGKETEVKSHHIHKGKDMIERSKDATILNLDKHYDNNLTFKEKLKTRFNQDYYDTFKKFNTKVVEQVANEVNNNTGDIIQKHVYDDKYTDDIEKIFKRYKETYIDSISLTDTHKRTKEGNSYPFFNQDLYNKNTVIYETFEDKYGIKTKIDEQTDEAFFETLGVRINGLKQLYRQVHPLHLSSF